MTARQRIKLKLIIDLRRNPPKDKDTFNRWAIGAFDCMDDADLIAELDRLEQQRNGVTRLLSEVWNTFEQERREDEQLSFYNRLVGKKDE
jgi:hypothetical protein